MSDFQRKYESLVSGIEAKKQTELVGLQDLQNSYKQIMGKEDPSIIDRINSLDSHYGSKIAGLEAQRKQFDDLMASSDDQLRILSSNERVVNPLDLVYSKAPEALLDKIKARKMVTQEYLDFRYPFKEETESHASVKKVPRITVGEHLRTYGIGSKIPPRISRLLDMILEGEGNILSRKVERAVSYITRHRDRINYRGNLLDLTKEELFGLEQRLRDLLADPSRSDERLSLTRSQNYYNSKAIEELNRELHGNLTKLIEYHEQTGSKLSRLALDGLGLPKIVLRVRALKKEFDDNQFFSPQQREIAYELMTDYTKSIQNAPSLPQVPINLKAHETTM